MPTVLILGASSDIGIAIAQKFAGEKWNVQLAGRNTAQLAPAASDIRVRYNVVCEIRPFDAIDFKSHETFFHSLEPRPDVTICVFGVMDDEEEAFDDWTLTERMIQTNYTGAVSILNVAAKYYISQQKGTIIGISSVAGDRGRASKMIYGSAKAAFSAYLSGLRNKCFKHNVHVMTVQPGFVYTRMTEDLDLPKLLTSTPGQVADGIYAAFLKKKNVVYLKWFWRYMMMMIKNIPEFQFKKMKL